jgi:hypothetical protein
MKSNLQSQQKFLWIRSKFRHLDLESASENLVSFILLVSLTYTNVRYLSEIRKGGHPYLTGDWLINYGGGYSGRGLNGQIIIFISDVTNISPLWLTYIEQVGLYTLYVLLVIKILRGIHNKFLWMIALSPVFIMFDFLDTGGAFRKEILGFAWLVLLIRLKQSGNFSIKKFFPIAFLYLLSAFSWEASVIFFLPTVYITFLMKSNGMLSAKKFRMIFSFYFIISLLSLLANFKYQLNTGKQAASAICNSLVQRGLDNEICAGTIYSVTSVSIDIPRTLEYLLIENKFFYYIPILMLSLLPFIWSRWILSNFFLTLFLFFSVFPVFLVGLDWGRWIHIFGTLVTLVWMMQRYDKKGFDDQIYSRFQVTQFIALSVFFTSTWRIPIAGGLPDAFFLGVIGRLISWF